MLHSNFNKRAIKAKANGLFYFQEHNGLIAKALQKRKHKINTYHNIFKCVIAEKRKHGTQMLLMFNCQYQTDKVRIQISTIIEPQVHELARSLYPRLLPCGPRHTMHPPECVISLVFSQLPHSCYCMHLAIIIRTIRASSATAVRAQVRPPGISSLCHRCGKAQMIRHQNNSMKDSWYVWNYFSIDRNVEHQHKYTTTFEWIKNGKSKNQRISKHMWNVYNATSKRSRGSEKYSCDTTYLTTKITF